MSKKHYLLLKQHEITGLKYLCYHFGEKLSCFKYNGSGLLWKKHIAKYGKNIHTIILKESDDRMVISEEGKKYSTMWNIVESDEFANLIIEDANIDTSRFRTHTAKIKRANSIKERIAKYGLSDAEKIARIKGVAAMNTPENRKKGKDNFRNRLKMRLFTDKELNRAANKRERIVTIGFTEKELASFARQSEKQKGKTIQERTNNPNYVDPRKGKKFNEIYSKDYQHPRKNKKLKDIKGDDYIYPISKPFKLLVNGIFYDIYLNESEFINKTNASSLFLYKLKKVYTHTTKRQSNSKHCFKHGDVIEYIPLSRKEYTDMKR